MIGLVKNAKRIHCGLFITVFEIFIGIIYLMSNYLETFLHWNNSSSLIIFILADLLWNALYTCSCILFSMHFISPTIIDTQKGKFGERFGPWIEPSLIWPSPDLPSHLGWKIIYLECFLKMSYNWYLLTMKLRRDPFIRTSYWTSGRMLFNNLFSLEKISLVKQIWKTIFIC